MLSSKRKEFKNKIPFKRKNECVFAYPKQKETFVSKTRSKFSLLFHRKKVLYLKQEIREGAYHLDNKLDIALDRMLEEIIG